MSRSRLSEKALSRLNRPVTMFIDYAELMAEDLVPLPMEDWLRETDRFLANSLQNMLEGKGPVSRGGRSKRRARSMRNFARSRTPTTSPASTGIWRNT